MFLYIRAIGIFIKRTLCRPFTILLLLLIPASAVVLRLLPDKEMSVSIKTGILIEQPDSYTDALINILGEEKNEFVFVLCDSKEEITDKVATGVLDCGFIIPNGVYDIFADNDTEKKITMYVSPASTFQYVSLEKLYGSLLKVYAPVMTNDYITDTYDTSYEEYVKKHFEEYMENDSVFSITASGSNKLSPSRQKFNSFPVYEFSGLIIFICGLLGILQFMKDEKNHAYDRLSMKKRYLYCGLNIAAGLIPAAIISSITLIIYGYSVNIFRLLGHILLYTIICLLYSLLYRCIFRTYVVYQAALPVIITLALLLTPIFIDFTEYVPALKLVSVLFAPYFF